MGGFPYHFLKPEYRHTWPEVLRENLEGHATVEVIDDLPTDVERYAPWDFQEVYVVGNHGYFMFGTTMNAYFAIALPSDSETPKSWGVCAATFRWRDFQG